jgi:hypothetical protein
MNFLNITKEFNNSQKCLLEEYGRKGPLDLLAQVENVDERVETE